MKNQLVVLIICVFLFISLTCFLYSEYNSSTFDAPTLMKYVQGKVHLQSRPQLKQQWPSMEKTLKYCNKYKNQTILNHLNQLTYSKSFLKLPNNVILEIFHYGKGDLISNDLIYYNQWENEIITPFINILKQDKSLHFIDIGSNLGVYSLAAASLGRQVVAVEAMEETCQRNYASIIINKFQNQIILLQNALSNYRGNFTIKKVVNNIGGSGKVADTNSSIEEKSLFTTMQSIYIDDLLEVITFDRCLMKMDIEGSEAQALERADILFSQLDIPIVLFEWLAYQGNFKETENVMMFFLLRGYRPFSSLASKEPDLMKYKQYENWPSNIVWKKEPYLFA